MVSLKQQVIEALSSLPDDSTLEDMLMHIELWAGVPEAEADVEAGRLYSTEEVKRRIHE